MIDFIGFISFSMVETMGATAIILTLFRYKLAEYIWPALAINFIMALQSYVFRDELMVPIAAPLLNALLLCFFVFQVVRIPLLWSFMVAISGFIISVLLQVLIVSISGYPLSEIQDSEMLGYGLQTTTGVILILASYVLYKFGIGFVFEFKYRKWERTAMIVLIALMLILLTVLLFFREVYIDISFLLLSLIVFAYYLFRKEAEYYAQRVSNQNSKKH